MNCVLLLSIALSSTATAVLAQRPPPPPDDGPWNRDIQLWRWGDPHQTEKVATFERAGVVTLARLGDGRLIAAHQHFPADDPQNFDTVAVRFSSDEGHTWTPPRVIQMAGLPEWMRFPFDPTLVPLPDGRLRLYFTGNRRRPAGGQSVPAIYSAITTDGVAYVFEPGVRFAITNRPVIDCAAVGYRGVVHLYAPDNGPSEPLGEPPSPRQGIAYHAVSRDGLNFVRAPDVRIPGNRRWLGNVVVDGGRLVFFGTADAGMPAEGPGALVWMASSSDGERWSAPVNLPLRGADPAAVRLRDGAWLIAVTSEPVRREAPPTTPPRERGSTPAAPPRLSRTVPQDAGSTNAPLLIGVGLHIEPFGAVRAPPPPADWLPRSPARPPPSAPHRLDYRDPELFRRHVTDIRQLANLVERFGGRLTVQAQTPFTRIAAETGETILLELERRGHEIALHFHEDAHLGPDCNTLDVADWAAAMRSEVEWIRRAGARGPIRCWSGGNLYTGVLAAAATAGLEVMCDHKNPRRQSTDIRLLGIHPWRPAGGPADDDINAFAHHDPTARIVYLPDGLFSRPDHAGMRRAELAGGDWRYFDMLTEGLELSLRAARADRVNVFHITLHPGEFRGRPDHPFAVIEAWFAQVVSPLVKEGRARWATFSQMADAYLAWERANPGTSPRPEQRPAATSAAPALASLLWSTRTTGAVSTRAPTPCFD
ncbi:MAG: glycoside hydrolase [Kiritimatiellae bacterium]|nr:glycoside hydrolase [Kiritimatiellia bacterium]